jgi:4-hydroxy-tetrahydrodipicolinate synthase
MFSGAIVAIVTPFKDGIFDEKAYKRLIEHVIAGGVSGIVPCGTTGESATMSHEEHERIIDMSVAEVGGRVKVIAGTGSNSTDEAISLTKHAKKAGADGILSVVPYYNKPTPKGLFAHFETIAKSCDIPVVLYNIPSRTGINMSAATTIALSKIDTIVGIKEASGDLTLASQIIKHVHGDFSVLAGDDALTLPMLSIGAKGVISVTANILPDKVSGMIKAWESGDTAKATEMHLELIEFHNAMFIETNPIPVKTALSMMGFMQEEFRLPMCKMDTVNKEKLAMALKEKGCI